MIGPVGRAARSIWPFREETGDQASGPHPENRVYVVGDIHGCHDLLERLIDRILAHLETEPTDAHLVFTGDYVDRGSESATVLKSLQNFDGSAFQSVTCLLGNHEEMMLRLLAAPSLPVGTQWLRNGGDTTAWSFGVIPPAEDSADAMADFAEALNDALTPDLREWLTTRPRMWRSGNLVVVHAGLDPKLPPDQQSPETLTWSRPAGKTRRKDGLWVAHGHTIIQPARVEYGRIATDTGAWFAGILTAAIIDPNGIVRFLDTETDGPRVAYPRG